MKKLLLINPVEKNRPKLHIYFQPLGLGIVGALTPNSWDVRLIDENFEELEILDVDLVAMTAFTPFVKRAYEIAAIYRQKNIPVVLGGFHASLLPEEALNFVDTVVIGSAEGAWEQLIIDFENNNLKRTYKGTNSFIAKPRRDLFSKNYPLASIETLRGCLNNCEFCSVSTVYEHQSVLKPVDLVISEFKEISHKHVFIVDDNMFGNRDSDRIRAISLYKELINNKINKNWWGYASVNSIAKEDELLYWAVKSGCYMFFLGFEADTVTGLKELNKRFNMEKEIVNYKSVIDKLHKYRISIFGGFIYGMDTDTPLALNERTRQIMNSNIDLPSISVLMPYPGTKIYKRFKDDNRITKTTYPDDWIYYDYRGITFTPKNMTQKELSEIMANSYKKLYNLRSIFLRAIRTLMITCNIKTALLLMSDNLMYRDIHINVIEPAYRKLLKKYSKLILKR